MPILDRVYAPYSVVAVFDGLTAATIDGLPDAVVLYLRSPAGRSLRRRPGFAGRDDLEIGARLRAAVERLPADTPLHGLIARAQALAAAPGALPVTVVVGGHAVAVRVPHEAMDGRGTIAFFRYVVDTAAGAEAALDERAVVRLPYLRMVARHLRPAAVRAYRQESAAAVAGPQAPAPTAADLALETARFETFVLDEEEAERFAALERRGSSSSARLGSLALGALRRVYRGTADLPVEIPVDLRRWAPSGRIDGNFIGVAPLGTLLGTDWSAVGLGGRVRDAMKARTPVVRSLHTLLWWVSRLPKRHVKRLLRRADGPGRLGVSLSMLVDPTDYADAAWLPGVPRRVGAATVGPWPSSTFVSIVQSAGRIRVTVWDESGMFDLAGFRPALDDELAARVPTR